MNYIIFKVNAQLSVVRLFCPINGCDAERQNKSTTQFCFKSVDVR